MWRTKDYRRALVKLSRHFVVAITPEAAREPLFREKEGRRKKMSTHRGELFRDNAGLWVRVQAHFYPIAYSLVPRYAREYDAVEVEVHRDAVRRVVTWTREPTCKRPLGFRPSNGVKVGRVTSYRADGTGTIDGSIEFSRSMVKAFGTGEVEVGEVIEYMTELGHVTRVTGPFGTHVSQCGKRLRS